VHSPIDLAIIKEHNEMNDTELNDAVTTLLITNYDFSSEEADDAVEGSRTDSPSIWNENSDAANLAKLLASDGDDD
jgi:hypothetical protein